MTHQQQCLAFFKSRLSLMLSTSNSQGILETSVAPFVSDGEHLYLFISELALHTRNILQLISTQEGVSPPGLVSCLLVADEVETEQMFARQRLTMQLDLAEIHRDTDKFESVMGLFESQFGDVITLLQSLPDFHLIQLRPLSGGYVKGFGQAFTFEGYPCNKLSPVKRL